MGPQQPTPEPTPAPTPVPPQQPTPQPTPGNWIEGTYTTGCWDCCKPSCSWPGKGSVTAPARSCHAETGATLTNSNVASVCDGGMAASCVDYSPIRVNDSLSMGYATSSSSQARSTRPIIGADHTRTSLGRRTLCKLPTLGSTLADSIVLIYRSQEQARDFLLLGAPSNFPPNRLAILIAIHLMVGAMTRVDAHVSQTFCNQGANGVMNGTSGLSAVDKPITLSSGSAASSAPWISLASVSRCRWTTTIIPRLIFPDRRRNVARQ